MSSNLIFFGNERLSTGFSPGGAPTLEALRKAGYHIAAVVSHFEPGTSRSSRKLEIATVAQKYNIPLLLPKKPAEVNEQLRSLNPAVGVLVAYGRIIPQSTIDLFPKGILNIHPSLLPAYRGPTPIEQAMLDGARQTGVSIMRLVKEMDAGPVYAQASIDLTGTETKQGLTERLLRRGGELLLEVLPRVLDGAATPNTQDGSAATFTPIIHKEDGLIDWSKSAQRIEREVRAYAGWPKSHASISGHDVIITKARVAADAHDGQLVVPCRSGYLEILELTGPSGRRMSGSDFMRGYQRAK